MEDIYKLPTALNQSLKNLSQSLTQSYELQNYLNAKHEYEADTTSFQLLQQLTAAQSELMQKQYDSQISRDDLKKIRDLQQRAKNNEKINAYSLSQQNAITFFREINDQISQLIGMNFAKLAKNSKC